MAAGAPHGVVTSKQNPQLKALRALRAAPERKRAGLFACEGEDLVQAAILASRFPRALFVQESERLPELEAASHEVLVCSKEALASVSELGHTPRCIAVMAYEDLPQLAVNSPGSGPGLFTDPAAAVALHLHGVGDPGNLGTLVRSVDGFGPAHIALGERCADPCGPKAVRASMGAIFRVPIVALDDAPVLPVIALDAAAPRTLADCRPHAPVAFALGAERSGVPQHVRAAAIAVVSIPLAPGAESLNVAMAGAIALYELRRSGAPST